jgi:alanyl-tRNA synthetase
MDAQREQSRRRATFDKAAMANMQTLGGLGLAPTNFLGYDVTEAEGTIVAILNDGGPTDGAEAGETVTIFLDRTPFYAESGGQVGDEGIIQAETGVCAVLDTQRPNASLIAHRARVSEGSLRVGDRVTASVDVTRRNAIRRNHTATHLIHRALHIVLGDHARQAGSLVAPDRLRFDFTHGSALSSAELRRIAEIVNDQVLLDLPVETAITTYEDAVAHGAMALFGEKYGDTVREVSIDAFSRELCGGTHVRRTGEIGPVVIVGEESSAAGIRRVEAITGTVAVEHIGATQVMVDQLAADFRARPEELPAKIQALRDQVRSREREIETLRSQMARATVGDLAARAERVNGATVLVSRAPSEDLDALGDQLRDRLGQSVIVLGTLADGKPRLLALVAPEVVAAGVRAGDIIREVAPIIGGRGGGRPERAQGGGTNADALDAALAVAMRHIHEALRKPQEE